MNRVVHFEIQAENPERAAKFCREVFGWKIDRWGQNPYWMVMTGEEPKDAPSKWPGINGGLLPRQGPPPLDGAGVNTFVCTVEVASAEEFAAKVVRADGKIVVPKMPIPGVGWQAYAKDTEGNIFGLHQADPQAK